MELEEHLRLPPPTRHGIFRCGVFSYYWIWINEGTDHQHKCWILNWRSRKRMIHLSHWTWWKPIRQFPHAMLESLRITSQKS